MANAHRFQQFATCADLSALLRAGTCSGWSGYAPGTAFPQAMAAMPQPEAADSGIMSKVFGGATPSAAPAVAERAAPAYTGTNNQVAGVDEGDIVKAAPDGRHVLTVSSAHGGSRLTITNVVPSDGEEARVVSTFNLAPYMRHGVSALFVNEDRVLVVGRSQFSMKTVVPAPVDQQRPGLRGGNGNVVVRDYNTPPSVMRPVYHQFPTVTVLVLNVTSLAEPTVLRRVDLEGDYTTARMVDGAAHVVVATPPHQFAYEQADGDMTPTALLPLYREVVGGSPEELAQAAEGATPGVSSYVTRPPPLMADVSYHQGARGEYRLPNGFGAVSTCAEVYGASTVNPDVFVSILTVPLVASHDKAPAATRLVATRGGNNVYASLNSIYVASATFAASDPRTVVTEFTLPTIADDGTNTTPPVSFASGFSVAGEVLNQFSMDEYNGNFRIVTSTREVQPQPHDEGLARRLSHWMARRARQTPVRMTNVFIIGAAGVSSTRQTVGQLRMLAPGEQVKSVRVLLLVRVCCECRSLTGTTGHQVRFMDEKALIVTFREVDPLFVLDLSIPNAPRVLGELKLPGYSELLHPINSTHIIGVGRDVALVRTRGSTEPRPVTQGLKLALFDISDPTSPRVAYDTVIGHRGTESPALSDHKAFFFDPLRGVVVLPVSLALVPSGQTGSLWTHGQNVFQGALAYAIGEDRFELLATITHDTASNSGNQHGGYSTTSFRADRKVQRTLVLPPVAEVVIQDDQAGHPGDDPPRDTFRPMEGAGASSFVRQAPGTLVTVSSSMLLSLELPSMHALAAVSV